MAKAKKKAKTTKKLDLRPGWHEAESKKPRNFILCPTCQSKSKKLRSEMGGLQTRVCKSGHYFEVDMFFGFPTDIRRVERTDRPVYTGPMSYTDYIYGRFKDDPTGKKGG